ncbi:MAG: hypothetical protein AAFR96_11110 [Planctomycetota bacterium]
MPETPDDAGGYLEPYREAVSHGGPTFEALLWRNREYQQARFRVLIESAAAGVSPRSVRPTHRALERRCIADMGCGRADLLAWLRTAEVPFGKYVGVEAITEFADASRDLINDSEGVIVEADFASDADLFESLVRSHGVEVFLFSGSLNTFKQPDAMAVIERACRAIEGLPSGGVVFNFLSSFSPKAGLVDTGPAHRFETTEVLATAARLSPSFLLRHDYLGGHDATVGIFASPAD